MIEFLVFLKPWNQSHLMRTSFIFCIFRNQKCLMNGRKLSPCTISQWTQLKESQYRWKSTSMYLLNVTNRYTVFEGVQQNTEFLIRASDVDFRNKSYERKYNPLAHWTAWKFLMKYIYSSYVCFDTSSMKNYENCRYICVIEVPNT